MSITFDSDARATVSIRSEHCLCAQDAERWGSGAHPKDLENAADPNCSFCGGTGVETREVSDAPSLNYANANGIALLRALRLPADYSGELPLAEARRAVIRARSGSFEAFARPEDVRYGKPRREGNVVEARPLRSFDAGLSADEVASRVEAFATFVEACAARGATKICWG